MKYQTRWPLLLMLGFNSCGWWQRGVSDRIEVSGNIELTEVNIAFKIPGRLVDLNLEEGMHVRKDAVLARLDQVQLERQRDRERAGLAVSESQLTQLMTSIEYQKAVLSAEIELREADQKQAQARLEELLAGSRKQEIEQAAAAVEEARTQNDQARKDWERAQILFKNDDITASQHDQYRTRLEATTAALRQAEERRALVVEGPRKEQIESARAQVERSRAALKLAEAQRLEIRRREQEVGARQAETRRAAAQIAIIEAQLADSAVASPIDGVVLVKSAEAGEIIAPGTTVATIGDIARPWLRAYINERDLGRLRLGARAQVTTDSFPGKIYPGQVSFIASEAEFTPKQIQTTEERVKLVYRIKIDLENPQQELKANMPADAVILLK